MKVMFFFGEIYLDIVECVNIEIKILINNDDMCYFVWRYNVEVWCSEFLI